MAIDTYADLKREIVNWSHRDDVEVGDTLSVPTNITAATVIDIAESEMLANEDEPLKLISEDTRATASMDATTPSRYLALPDGYQKMRKLRIQIENGESVEIHYRSPGQLEVLSTTGMPRFFTVTSQLEFDRVPDIAYSVEMQYLKDFLPLSTTNTTNQVLTDHPNIYLFGGLWALNNWAEQEQVAQRYYQQFISAIRGANKKAKLGRYGPAPMMRVEGWTP